MKPLHYFSPALWRQSFWATLLTSVALCTAATAAPVPLAPLTKLRLSVVQFIAASGDYKRWDALSGDFEIGADGTLAVPTLDPIDTAGLSADELGTQIASRLQTKLGLLDTPDASVQVLDYPPVYIVGHVATPGAYDFRPGMSVIQALALAGGEQRLDSTTGLSETIKLQSDIEGYGNDVLRTTARLARLKAEFTRQSEIAFDDTLDADDPVTAEILQQEQRIFEAHSNEFSRQQTGLVQLAALYEAEIDALGQKAAAIEEQIARAQQQVDGITGLVASGSATVSRLTDAERILDDLRSDKLDNVIATMAGRENLNHSQRDLAKLQDEQQSQAAAALQEGQATLEKLMLNQTAAMRMLRQSIEFDNDITQARNVRTGLSYAILRQDGDQIVSLAAGEASVLLPGDLVKVTMELQMPASAPASSLIGLATAP